MAPNISRRGAAREPLRSRFPAEIQAPGLPGTVLAGGHQVVREEQLDQHPSARVLLLLAAAAGEDPLHVYPADHPRQEARDQRVQLEAGAHPRSAALAARLDQQDRHHLSELTARRDGEQATAQAAY